MSNLKKVDMSIDIKEIIVKHLKNTKEVIKSLIKETEPFLENMHDLAALRKTVEILDKKILETLK